MRAALSGQISTVTTSTDLRSAGLGIAGFDYTIVTVGPTTYRPGIAGSGPPVLLLHGYPQTHYCWHLVAPMLTDANTVVVCDLKGYGESRAAPGGPLGEGYSNRERAAELVALMAQLGHGRFSVVGHDRGGRVAYRMALDHPGAVERLGVLNIVPTVEQFERMAADASLDYYPWFLLAQPPPFAERVVSASAEYILRHILTTWTATPGSISPQALRTRVHARDHRRHVRRLPRVRPHRPARRRRRSRAGAQDRLSSPRRLGSRRRCHVRQSRRLAPMG